MILGIIILIIGILVLVSVLNPDFVVNYSLVWPGALILLCLYSIYKNKKIDVVPGVGLFLGILIFGVNCGLWDSNVYELIFPGILIIIGLTIIISSIRFKNNKNQKQETNKEGILTYTGIFAGIEERVTQKEFKGANIYAIFGGVDLDLRNIEIKEDIVINAYSVFGGATLLVPKNYNIKVNSSAILGGNDNKATNEHSSKQKTIYINCLSVFGGCEIK